MNAAELIAAIRAEHVAQPDARAACCAVCVYTVWPCPPAVAADRIEAAIEENDRTHPEWCNITRVLDGE